MKPYDATRRPAELTGPATAFWAIGPWLTSWRSSIRRARCAALTGVLVPNPRGSHQGPRAPSILDRSETRPFAHRRPTRPSNRSGERSSLRSRKPAKREVLRTDRCLDLLTPRPTQTRTPRPQGAAQSQKGCGQTVSLGGTVSGLSRSPNAGRRAFPKAPPNQSQIPPEPPRVFQGNRTDFDADDLCVDASERRFHVDPRGRCSYDLHTRDSMDE